MRTARVALTSSLVAATIATAGLVLSPLAQAEYSPLAATTDVNVRQDPNSTAAVLAVLSAGDTVTQRGSEENGWLPITYDEKNAWVQAQYVSATTAVTSQSTVSTAVVNKDAYVRSSAAADGWIMGSLAKGTTVPVIGDPQGSWTPVNYYGRSGWISTSLLGTSTTDSSVKITSAVSQDYLWVRTGESTAYPSIGMLYPDDKATVTGDPYNGWVPISFNGQSAYVAANYARYSSDPSIITLSASTQNTSSTSTASASASTASASESSAAPSASASTASPSASESTATPSASATTAAPAATESTAAPSETESSATPSATETTSDPAPAATETSSAPQATESSSSSTDDSATTPAWTTDDVNLRSGPGADSPSVQVLAEQTQVALTGTTNGDWSEVVYNGSKYWINTRFVSTTQGTTNDTPATDTSSTPAATDNSDDSDTVGPSADALPATSGTKYTTADLNAYLTSDQPKPATAVIPSGTSVATTDTVENNRVEIVWNNTAYWVSVDYLSSSQPADNTATSSTTSSTTTSDSSSVASSGSSTDATQTAVNFAMSKVGLPYIWGGTGPSGYDCSGLVQAAYAQAGISLPRTTWDQVNAGTQISLSDVQVGDLVFFYDNSHVGIYIGNGQVVNALNENVGILVSSISYLGTPSAVVRVA